MSKYTISVRRVREHAQAFVPIHKIARPIEDNITPKYRAMSGSISFKGIGRFAVLGMSESSSFSIHWLSAAAPHAASAVPNVSAKNQ